MDYKKLLADIVILQDVDSADIEPLITVPKDPAMGDYCLPCFKFAKEFKKSPVVLANEIVSRIGSYNFLERQRQSQDMSILRLTRRWSRPRS